MIVTLFIVVVEANRVEKVPETVLDEDPISVEKYTFPMVASLETTVDAFSEDTLIEGPVS